MILNEVKKDSQVSGKFATSGFRIDASSKAFQILSSNIYQHKVRAVIRELACNAIDAPIEAGMDTSILPDVHLPTTYEPWFSIRDYGPGLSENDVKEVFTVYFCSTKTQRNDLTGALGLGAKSFYCLVDSAIINSYQNGMVYNYSAYKDEDDMPQMALLRSGPSDEPSGLEIIVHVNNRTAEFINEAVEVFKYFDVVPNINNQSVMERIQTAKQSYKIVGKDYAFNSESGTTKALMGNVAYNIPSEYLYMSGYIRFNLGELSFDPGRENLTLDAKTISVLRDKIKHIKDNLADDVVRLIEELPTSFQRAQYFDQINTGVIGDIIVTHRDKFKYRLPKCKSVFKTYSKQYRSTAIQFGDILPLGPAVEYYLLKPKFQARIKAYLKNNDSVKKVVLLTNEQIDELSIDRDQIKDLDTIPKITYSRSASKPVKVKRLTDYGWTESDVVMSEEYVYVHLSHGKPKDYSFDTISGAVRAAKSIGVEIDVYGLSPQVKKVGAGIELSTFLKDNVELPEKAILRDPANKNLLKMLDKRFSTDTITSDKKSLYSLIGTVTHDDSLDKLSKAYFDKYPLLEFIYMGYGHEKAGKAALLTYVTEKVSL
jgi:hypothetical protein